MSDLIEEVKEALECHIFNHNKHVERIDKEQAMEDAMYQLKERLVELALDGTDIRC